MLLARSLVFLAAALPLLVPAHDAQTLVKDFNLTPSGEVGSSGPNTFTPLPNGELLFVARTPEHGDEPWVTDGTAAGTHLLLDVYPGLEGSLPRSFATLANGLVLFVARTPDHGFELWRTDGTSAGTSLVLDAFPGPPNGTPVFLTVVGAEVFYFAQDGVHGIEPWKSDGTAAGTAMISDVVVGGSSSNGTAQMQRLGTNEVVFSVLTGSGWELWRSDGTAPGTTFVQQVGTSTTWEPGHLTPFGPKVLFDARVGAAEERWITDGTTAGTFSLGVAGSGPFQVVGSTAYFGAFTAPTGSELWRTDGTVAGTGLLLDLAPGATSSGASFLGELGGQLLFDAADDGIDRDLWTSDGTAAGTVKVSEASFAPGFFGAHFVTRVGAHLYFPGSDGVTEGLWRTDGTGPGTTLVHPDLGYEVGPLGSSLVAAGEDPVNGVEPWLSDGTPAGSALLVDLVPSPATLGSNVKVLGTFRDRALLSVDDGVVGNEVWITDGTAAGTQLLVDATPGTAGSYVGGVLSNDETLVLWTGAFLAPHLTWISDGTPAGTVQLPLAATYPGFRVTGGVPFRDGYLLSAWTDALGVELWFSDGTLAGTALVLDVDPTPGASSGPSNFVVWDDRVLFLADDGLVGAEPWITDGTPAGTYRLADTNPGPLGADWPDFTPLGDHVYFRGASFHTGDAELWRTDGTVAGTSLFVDLDPGPSSSRPANLLRVGDHLVFTAQIAGQRQLYTTDGTVAGTLPLTSVIGGLSGPLRVSDDLAFLLVTADGPANQTYTTAWTTGGTPTTTDFLGPFAFAGDFFTAAANPTDDEVVLGVDDQVIGIELWSSDGTIAGTAPLFDLSLTDSYALDVTRVGDRVVFTADDGVHGRELFAFPLDLIGDEAVSSYGYGVAGTNGVPTLDVEGEADASATQAFELVVADALASTGVILAWSREPAAVSLPSVTLWTGGLVQLVIGGSDANGRASFPFVPNPTLAGQRFVAQAFALDPAGAAFGLASATAGLELVVGP